MLISNVTVAHPRMLVTERLIRLARSKALTAHALKTCILLLVVTSGLITCRDHAEDVSSTGPSPQESQDAESLPEKLDYSDFLFHCAIDSDCNLFREPVPSAFCCQSCRWTAVNQYSSQRYESWRSARCEMATCPNFVCKDREIEAVCHKGTCIVTTPEVPRN